MFGISVWSRFFRQWQAWLLQSDNQRTWVSERYWCHCELCAL